MPDPEERNRPRRIWRVSWATRVLAPLALIIVLGAVYVVVNSAKEDNGNHDPVKAQVAGNGKGGKKAGKSDSKKAPKTYTIKSGDSLSAIAEKFGISVDDLERWNTNVDPNALVAGDELKIR